jgi:hypothetical protein
MRMNGLMEGLSLETVAKAVNCQILPMNFQRIYPILLIDVNPCT